MRVTDCSVSLLQPAQRSPHAEPIYFVRSTQRPLKTPSGVRIRRKARTVYGVGSRDSVSASEKVRFLSPSEEKQVIDRGNVMVIDVGEAWQIE